jgi:malate dehydrogenase (oxaloacetate-decarboxylating)(NADP+)
VRRDERGDAARPTLFIADTYVNIDPAAEDIAEITRSPPTRCAASASRRSCAPVPFELRQQQPPAGEEDAGGAGAHQRENPDLEVEGEMHGDAALDEDVRARAFPELAAQGARRTS